MGQRSSKQNSSTQQESKTKLPDQELVEAWSRTDVDLFLKSIAVPLAIVDQFHIDGDILIELHQSQTLPAFAQHNPFPPALLEKSKAFADQYDKRLNFPMPKPNFDPYEIPAWSADSAEQLLAALYFFHKMTENGENGGARNVRREWLLQPRIQRRYIGSPYRHLPTTAEVVSKLAQPLPLQPSASNAPSPLDENSLSSFLFHSLAMSGCKDQMSLQTAPKPAWSKRVNASSGGLHPVEAFLLLPELSPPLPAALYHYHPPYHGLELLLASASLPVHAPLWAALPANSFVLALAGLHWREVWKYGERGLRYSLLDIGHALGAVWLGALLQGWQVRPLDWSSTDIERMFGLQAANEHESPDGMIACLIGPNLSCDFQPDVSNFDWPDLTPQLLPTAVSLNYTEWELITAARQMFRAASRSFRIDLPNNHRTQQHPEPALPLSLPPIQADHIRSRRSATTFDEKAFISLESLERILATVLPHCNPALAVMGHLTSDQETPNFVLYIQRVTDVRPGVYLLKRNDRPLPTDLALVPATWTRLPLYEVSPAAADAAAPTDTTDSISQQSRLASCLQNIALHSAFTLGMLARPGLPSDYVRLHLDCGRLGQLLYVAAGSEGLMASGMGCYVEQRTPWPGLGLDLYHFTIGTAAPDKRYQPYSYQDSMFAACS